MEALKDRQQIVAFAAVPMAPSLLILVPAIAIGFGTDWFRTGGDDEGNGRPSSSAIGLAFAAWSLGLRRSGPLDLPLAVEGVLTAFALGDRDRRGVRRPGPRHCREAGR